MSDTPTQEQITIEPATGDSASVADPAPLDSALSTQHSAPNPIDEIKARDLESRVVEALRTVYDPEIPVNIYEMGLVYNIRTTADGVVCVAMTLTSPACPVAGSLPIEVEQKIKALDGVTAATVNIVWEPPWTPEKMSEAAKLQLGFL